MGGSASNTRCTAAAALLLALAGCGGGDEVVVNQQAGIPAEVAIQANSTLTAELPEDPPRISWRMGERGGTALLELAEEDGHVSLTLACGGTPPRLTAHVPSFTPSSAGEPMRLAIGPTEIALAPAVAPETEGGSAAEAVIPANLATLFARATAVDVVQGVQRIGVTPAPPRDVGARFAEACQAHSA